MSKAVTRKGKSGPATELSDFIRANIERIIEEWERFAASLPSAQHMDRTSIRDHASGMLREIADDLDRAGPARKQTGKPEGSPSPDKKKTEAKKHGSSRWLEGFSIGETMAEFRSLRTSVARLWMASNPSELQANGEELVQFNEAVDRALTESLKQYSFNKDRHTRLFDTLLSSTPDLAAILDPQGKFTYVNKAMAEALKLPPGEIVGKNLFDLGSPNAALVQGQMQQVIDSKKVYRAEITSRLPEGKEVTYEYYFFPVADEEGEVEAVAGIGRDITERKLSVDKLSRRANYDALTGLPNRSLFLEQLRREVNRAMRNGLQLALFFIDLDTFKEVNDRLGHDAGDELLLQSAQRISACVRNTDTAARLGGDEFTVMLTEVKRNSHVERVARKILDELARPFSILGKEVHISGSIGVTLFPQDAATPDDLMRNADQSMYVAKEEGGNRYRYFTQSMQQAAQERTELIADMKEALNTRHFCIYYQPIVDLDSGHMHMAEALVRWEHPRRGMVDPEEFIPLAEEVGVMVEIGDWVFREAARLIKKIREKYDPDFRISLNYSITQFRKDSTSPDAWLDYLQELNLAGESIVIEIMESMLMDSSALTGEKISAFRKAGIQVSLDDFGTGFSSVSYLKKFDINYVKIDRPFVHNLISDSDAEAICDAIIVMAHKLGLKVIAEGVETAEQKDRLASVECDYAQGYLFSEPVSSRELENLLAAGKPRPGNEGAAHMTQQFRSGEHLPSAPQPGAAASRQRKHGSSETRRSR